MKKPYLIIGAGIIGSAIAREIRKRDLGDVVVLEKERALGMHASGRNSGVFHSGISHVRSKDSDKVRLCIDGNKESKEYCQERGVPYLECGKLIIAKDKSEMPKLEALIEGARRIGVPGLRIIDKDELNEIEPNAKGHAAIFSSTDAIVDSQSFLETMVREAISLGAVYLMSHKVVNIKDSALITNNGDFEFSHLINCAGLYADRIAHMMNLGRKYRIIPFKGKYLKVDTKINSMVYQVPDPEFPFLKVHLTKTIGGDVLAGPTSTWAFSGRESYEGKFNANEFLEQVLSRNLWNLAKSGKFRNLVYENAAISLFKSRFVREVNGLIREQITKKDVTGYRAGIRAQLVDNKGRMIDDIIVEQNTHSTHILNAISPGMTLALPFARYFVGRYLK